MLQEKERYTNLYFVFSMLGKEFENDCARVRRIHIGSVDCTDGTVFDV